MREPPIIFSGEMVRAILDGRKTQTRRVVNVRKGPFRGREVSAVHGPHTGFAGERDARHLWSVDHTNTYGTCVSQGVVCPFGQLGDRLWVRETHYLSPARFCDRYSESYNVTDLNGEGRICGYAASMNSDAVRFATDYGLRKRPSIHMPRWASRITLGVTNVRVERVQDISWQDAIAEGMTDPRHPEIRINPTHPDSPACQYGKLWNSINAKRGYAMHANPLVWVVEFRRATKEQANEN